MLDYFSCSLFFILIFFFFFFFFNDTATTEIYTLSLHDALPISSARTAGVAPARRTCRRVWLPTDRKSTRLNSSHLVISYAVFCLKKKKKKHLIKVSMMLSVVEAMKLNLVPS